MAANTTTDDVVTTADFARMAAQGWTAQPASSEQSTTDPATSPAPPAGPKNVAAIPKVTPKPRRREKQPDVVDVEETVDIEPRWHGLLDASAWTAQDFGAIAPQPLREVIAEHRERSHAMESGAARGFYALYAAPATFTGVTLNILSWVTSRISALLTGPREPQPPALVDVIATHAERARATELVVWKVLYAGWATLTTPVTAVLNTVSWVAAQTAVAINDPHRLGRVVLALLFVAVVIGGLTAVL